MHNDVCAPMCAYECANVGPCMDTMKCEIGIGSDEMSLHRGLNMVCMQQNGNDPIRTIKCGTYTIYV